ncbi:MAG: NAD-dependent deacylase [candidate division Zixibacteria bacterium]|nr:NAD-dependent deacylase [candidate division Zixibacteria bacterium]
MTDELVEIMLNCRRCAVLTGAGISAESGVPTFRGKQGLWKEFKPEELATMSAFMANPNLVWQWYNWRRELMGKVEPNPGHQALAELEDMFTEFTLITQNIDGLHRHAGSKNILELHGNIHRNKCADCNRQVAAQTEIDPDNIPTCEQCGGRIRPDVVWFGEMLDTDIISTAFRVSEESDVFLSIGTSAIVHPAASLPMMAKRSGATLIEINPERTPLTELADFYVSAKSGEFLPPLVKQLRARRTDPKA